MNKTKFYEIKTNEGRKSINVDNIASIEDIYNIGIKITLNVKDENGINLTHIARSVNYNKVTKDIEEIILNQ